VVKTVPILVSNLLVTTPLSMYQIDGVVVERV